LRFAPLSWLVRQRPSPSIPEYAQSLSNPRAAAPGETFIKEDTAGGERMNGHSLSSLGNGSLPAANVSRPPSMATTGESPEALRRCLEGGSLSALFRPFVLLLLILCLAPISARADTLRAGILKFGTVEWLLDVIKRHKFDAQEGYQLSSLALASNNALQVELLGREADVIVTDWFWVLRQRAAGDDFQFAPYSTAVGAVMVPANSPIKDVADLKDRKLGVAGGPLDKSWLLLRARSRATSAGDLIQTARPIYGAPPLLNQQMIYGDVDALLTYWHFAAQLEAAGFKRLASVSDLMKEVGLKTEIPLIGFVFSGKLAKAKPDVIAGFIRSARAAQDVLLKSDAEWEQLRPLMRPQNDAEFIALRDRYREGITFAWGPDQQAEAAKLFGILAKVGGDELTGKNVAFDPQVFWQAPSN
jgi:NitT/TauT family transport system substrate-binding protein